MHLVKKDVRKRLVALLRYFDRLMKLSCKCSLWIPKDVCSAVMTPIVDSDLGLADAGKSQAHLYFPFSSTPLPHPTIALWTVVARGM